MFFKMQKMGRYVGHLSPTIKYYDEEKGTGRMLLPRGVLDELQGLAKGIGAHLETADGRSHGEPVAFPRDREPVALRGYQLGIVEEVTARDNGVVRCGTGFGKTVVALAVSQRLGLKSLFVVPKSHLADQLVAEAGKFLGVEARVLGRKVRRGDAGEEGGPIDVATIQWLQRNPEWAREHRDDYGLLIADECHQLVPEKSRRVIQAFNPKHLYGLTATPRRSDGQGGAISLMFGEVLADRDLPRASPTVKVVSYSGHIPMGEYGDIVEFQVGDPDRNRLVASVVEREILAGRKVLVLTKRVAHYEAIRSMLPDYDAIVSVSSVDPNRQALMSGLRSGERIFDCLLGTFSLLGTGIDLPTLDTLVIAGDLKSDVLAEQACGRILRLFEGKKDPVIMDVADVGNPILRNQARERKKFYASMGWTVG